MRLRNVGAPVLPQLTVNAWRSYDSPTSLRGASPFSLVVAGSTPVPVYRCALRVAFVGFCVACLRHKLSRRVWSDTLLQTEGSATFGTPAAPVNFTLGTPRGTGALAFGDITQETNLPASGSREQLVVRCANATTCKFARELKAGYLLVIDASSVAGFSNRLPVTRVITSIISDTQLTVDADFNQGSFLGSDYLNTKLPHSGTAIAGSGQWTFVSCPPRVGKRANGAGTIESSWNQGGWSTLYPKLDPVNVSIVAGNLGTASGGATGLQHRIVGRGTRFASQFGSFADWGVSGSGGYYGQGPYLTVQVRSRARLAALAAG